MPSRRPARTPRPGAPPAIATTAVALALLLAACGAGEPTTAAEGTAAPPTGATAAPTTGTAVPPLQPTSTETTEPAPTSSSTPVVTATVAPPVTPAPTEARPLPESPAPEPAPASPPPAPLPAGATSVFVLGDSVLLGTTYGTPPPLVAALPGWDVTLDCAGSRRLAQGLGVLEARRSEIGRVAVIQLGNNYIPGEGGTFGQQIDQAMAILAGTDRVVWVTVGEAIGGRADLNAEIRAAATRHPTIVVADWAALVAADPSLAPGDGLHLSNEGRTALSALVAGAIGPAPA